MNMFTNGFEKEAGPIRLIGSIAAAAATAVGIAVLIGLETSFRENIDLLHVGGYLSLPLWIFCISIWGSLGGGIGIVLGAFAPRRRAFWMGMAAGLVPLVLIWALKPRDPWESYYYVPHPPGVLAHLLEFLLPALPGGVGARLMSGGQRGTA
jgi:hypothetical protein